jgi:phage gpG-like protein
MISIIISGVDKAVSALERMSKINSVVGNWMKSGEPDEIMQKSIEQNFAKEGRPSWQLLADETMLDRTNKGFSSGPTLTRTGSLRDELTSLRGKVEIGGMTSSITWGAEQLRGEQKVKFSAHQRGKGRTGQKLPARPMLGFQKEDGKRMVNGLRSWILKSF